MENITLKLTEEERKSLLVILMEKDIKLYCTIKNQIFLPATYVVVNGEKYSEFRNEDEFFTFISKIYAFSDYTNDKVEDIKLKGREIEYVGWQSCMLFEYFDSKTGDDVWSRHFFEWDH